MKKLIALLMACTTMTCVFASCGNEEKESSVSKDNSVSDESSEETTTEPVTEEETEEETTEEETETKEETEKTTREYLEDADATAFLGKWECEKMVVEGEEMTDLMGIPVYAVFQLDIKDDNTASMADTFAEFSDSEEAITYTWGMVSDTEMEIVNEDGDAMLLTIDGDYLVGIEEGFDEQIYLVKVDEFTPFDFESFINGFSDSDKSAFLGKWECEKAVIDGEEITDINGIPLYVMFQFDFKEDGTVLLGEDMAELMDETICSWSMESKTEIVVTDEDDDLMVFTADGDYLVGIDSSDDMIYLVRVDEFTHFDIESFMNE